jgi:hypothetical protein
MRASAAPVTLNSGAIANAMSVVDDEARMFRKFSELAHSAEFTVLSCVFGFDIQQGLK